MTDPMHGIAGGLSNGLAVTNDNWKTSKQIPTPIDQHKFKILRSSARNDVSKLLILDNTVIINQNDYIYY
jgi:hypothetical protein